MSKISPVIPPTGPNQNNPNSLSPQKIERKIVTTQSEKPPNNNQYPKRKPETSVYSWSISKDDEEAVENDQDDVINSMKGPRSSIIGANQ